MIKLKEILKEEKKQITEASMPKFEIPKDVSYYYARWRDVFNRLRQYNDYGPRENDMYDWNSRANYQAATKEFHGHMSKIANKLNSAVNEMGDSWKVWKKIIKKHRKNDGS